MSIKFFHDGKHDSSALTQVLYCVKTFFYNLDEIALPSVKRYREKMIQNETEICSNSSQGRIKSNFIHTAVKDITSSSSAST